MAGSPTYTSDTVLNSTYGENIILVGNAAIANSSATLLGKGVYRQYGVAESGFQISSCQFAMHYFFENKTTFHGFLRNIAECTKVNGYFVGTCYDGKSVFDLLRKKKNGEGMTILKNEHKIYELTKMYDETGFPDDDMSLGYAINVYQESINQVLREYLVNFAYFTRIMEDYGFILVPVDEARHMDLPNGSGLFSELYTFMENEVKRNPYRNADYGKALLMSPDEKRISFLNRYFVFKKVRNVNVKKMAEVILKQAAFLEKEGEENVKALEEEIEAKQKTEPSAEPVVVKKLAKPKLVLKKKNKDVEPLKEVAQEPLKEVTTIKPTGPPMKLKIRQPKPNP